MNNSELGKEIAAVSHLHGSFTLRSKQTSSDYFDKYAFESKPKLLREISSRMVDLVPSDTDYLAGLELGGVPLATAISLTIDLPTVFVRKSPKPYGTCRLAEGAEIAGEKLCIVEDIVTSGGQIIESARALRERGAIVQSAICVILRKDTALEVLAEQGILLSALFRKAELEEPNANKV